MMAVAASSHGDPPAFTISLSGRSINWASAAGVAAWGLTRTPDGAHLDIAMPALRDLLTLAHAPEPPIVPRTLTFWTEAGLRRWPCAVRFEHDPVAGILAHIEVIGSHDVEPPPPSPAPAAATPETVGRPASDTSAAHDEALAKIAHELRTPLAAIASLAEVMAHGRFGPLGNARYQDYVQSIGETARHALSVVQAMLEPLAREQDIPEQTFTELDLNQIATEAVRSAEPLAGKAGFGIVLSLADALPRVIADQVAVRQILLNLIANAIQHADGARSITIRTGVTDGQAWLEAEDDGPGFSAERLASSAAQWRSRTPFAEGSGFGLALARSLAEANGATLVIGNAMPHGAKVRLSFAASRVLPV